MKATKNLRKSIISGLLTLVMAAAMFVCMGKVEVQAATKAAFDLNVGDILQPGDIISGDGAAISLSMGLDANRETLEYVSEGNLKIKDSYNGNKISKLIIKYIDKSFEYDGYFGINVENVADGSNAAPTTPPVPETPETPSVPTGPKQLEDGTFFDAAYYAATYPDVAAALGTDEAALYNHYVSYGKAEGRFPNAAATPSVTGPKQMADGGLFDAAYYAATYPDVVAAFGTDEAMLYNHYVLCGKAEGRLPYAM